MDTQTATDGCKDKSKSRDGQLDKETSLELVGRDLLWTLLLRVHLLGRRAARSNTDSLGLL